jgi:hypothetical protein
MPKRILLIAFATAAIALAACNSGYNPEDLYGTPAPIATTATATPNPTVSSAVVTVYVSNSPLPNQTVNLSTDVSGTAGSLIASQVTNSAGTTTFLNLTPGANYCFTSSYTPPSEPMQNFSQCGFFWFNGVPINFSS